MHLKRCVVPGLLALAVGLAMATPSEAGLRQELRTRCKTDSDVERVLHAEYPQWVETADALSPDMARYLVLKHEGEPIPASLSQRLFPAGPVRDGARQGGDTPAEATAIDALPYTDSGTTSGYTHDAGTNYSGNDVFYSLELEGMTFITLSLCGGSTWDTVLQVYDNADGSLGTLLYSSDDACGAQSELVEVGLAAGSYFVNVDGYSTNSMGDYTLNITTATNPCDGYAETVVAATAPTTLTGDNSGYSDVYGGDGGDAGFELTIPSAGLWDINACQAGTMYDCALYLFSASPCDGGELIASSTWSDCQAPWGAGILPEIPLEAGTYHLMVSDDWTTTGAFEVLVQPTAPRPTSGGPDEMGYVWANSLDPEGPDFEWVDIDAAGTPVTLTDDSYFGPIEMGIDFPFYEGVYSQCWIGSNGYVSFTQGYTSLGAQPFPTPTDGWSPDNFIAPFWDDLWPPASDAWVKYLDDPENDRFIVTFHNVPGCCSDSNPRHTFQLILYANGDYQVQYQSVDESDLLSLGAGQENTDGTIGLQYRYRREGALVGDGVAWRVDALEGDFRPPMITLGELPADIETELPGNHAISATITDESGVQSATIHYTLNGGEELTTPLSAGANDLYSGAIPHQPANTMVVWWVVAVDATDLHNTRTTAQYSFDVVSYQTAPLNLAASDGQQTGTLITWSPPPSIEVWTLFGGQMPAGEDEAIARLVAEHGMTKLEAAGVWQRWQHNPDREFESFRLYRDGELLVETSELQFTDFVNSGSEADVTYTYAVSAVFTAGESDLSIEDTGYWASAPSVGGPDAFGYIWRSSLDPGGPAYSWTDISGVGTALALSGDDAATQITLPFEFPFYGNFYSSAYVSTNGYVTFQPTATPYWNGPLPSAELPSDAVYAMWDDLYVNGSTGLVYQYDDTANDRVIIQWNDINPLSDTNVFHTFQIILSASGIATVVYEDIAEAQVTDCTRGIENADGSIGLQVTYDAQGAPITDESVVVFLPPSNCEPVECAGIAEVEPNEGWADGSYNLIRCGETVCGTVLANGGDVDTDWFLYNHFGGNITVALDVSDFNGRVTLREQAPGGQILAQAGSFPRCFDEAFAVQDLQGGSYYIVVEHTGDPDVATPQTYALTLTCSGDPCSGHQPVECTGTPEAEPNEGWNATPPNASYGTISYGESVCGTVWAHDNQRDMDWFRFHLDATTSVEFNLSPDAFDAALYITQFDPAGAVLLEVNNNPACAPEAALIELAAGDYFVAAGHSSFEGVDTPQNYRLTFGVDAQPEDPCTNYHDTGNFNQVVNLDRAAPMRTHHDGTGCPGGVSSPGRDEVVRLVLTATTSLRVEMTGQGNADEVLLLLGNCAQPGTSCGAAANGVGAGQGSESMVINNLPAGDYFVVADFAGNGETAPYHLLIDTQTALDEGRPLNFELRPVHPNPFNPATTFSWTQPRLANATLTVHDLRGATVETVDLGVRGAGDHSYVWDASRLGSGTYFCTLSTAGHSKTVKAVLIK